MMIHEQPKIMYCCQFCMESGPPQAYEHPEMLRLVEHDGKQVQCCRECLENEPEIAPGMEWDDLPPIQEHVPVFMCPETATHEVLSIRPSGFRIVDLSDLAEAYADVIDRQQHEHGADNLPTTWKL